MLAASAGHLDTAKAFLTAGADVNATTVDGDTALMIAAFRGHADIVRLLVDNRANVAWRNRDGQTAAAIAESKGHSGIVTLLKGSAPGMNREQALAFLTDSDWCTWSLEEVRSGGLIYLTMNDERFEVRARGDQGMQTSTLNGPYQGQSQAWRRC
jgi:hypothetical protein